MNGNKPPLFISHATRNPNNTSRARAVLQRLYEVLHEDNNLISEDKKWNVFVDEQRLNPGDTWRPIILQNLARCRAGIILFDRWAINQSTWVKAEAHILCFRKSIDPDFQLIPVLFEDLDLKDTCFNDYEPFELNAILVAREDKNLSVNQVADQIISCLNPEKAANTTRELYGWTHHFKLLIENHPKEPLSRARNKLSAPEEVAPGNIICLDEEKEEMRTAIAQLMHIHEPMEILDAVQELNKQQLETRALRKMELLLKTKWVDTKTVEMIFNSVRHWERLGLLTYPIYCGNQAYFVTSLFERLQTECPDNFYFDWIGLSGAKGETDKVIVAEIQRAIKNELSDVILDIITGSNNIPPDSKAFRRYRDKIILVICHVPAELARIGVLKELRTLYPKIIFLVSLKNSEDADELEALAGATLLPPFDATSVYDFGGFARELKTCGINLNWEKDKSEFGESEESEE